MLDVAHPSLTFMVSCFMGCRGFHDVVSCFYTGDHVSGTQVTSSERWTYQGLHEEVSQEGHCHFLTHAWAGCCFCFLRYPLISGARANGKLSVNGRYRSVYVVSWISGLVVAVYLELRTLTSVASVCN